MAAPRKLKLPVPVTIITGSLGAGKTTVMRHLVANKPPDEVWAIVVNEFGAVGIDGAAIQAAAPPGAGGAVVKQIAGGCMCCVSSGLLTAAVAQIVRQVKPDRLLLEPSGLGHPGGLVDVLQGEHLRSALLLNAIVCLVDLTSFDPDVLEGVGVISDQIAIADVLLDVLVICNGELDPSLLDRPRSGAFAALTAAWRKPAGGRGRRRGGGAGAAAAAAAGGGVAAAEAAAPAAAAEAAAPLPRAPARIARPAAPGGGAATCGWVFHVGDVFDRTRLLRLLRALRRRTARAKGVFRVGPAQWAIPGAARRGGAGGGGELSLEPICYRGQSCAEVIFGGGGGGAGAGGGGEGEEGFEAEVAAAVAAAEGGELGALEALFVGALAGG
ncbi:MAG: CobW/HypB/UreG, nucleotide-binding domain-containing protein [Monoraphidium minutum]|nr:MAG: CobW/HypB/UreG, nucleotide-binding domain-containing protein [Monoraphidium minutum]